MTSGLRKRIFGIVVIVDIFTQHGIRRSPGSNNRSREIGKCARGKSLDERKKCFQTSGPKGGGKRQAAGT